MAQLRRAQQLRLGALPILDPWGQPERLLSDSVEVGDISCSVILRDGGTRIHLNLTNESELRRLMSALRIDDRETDRAAQAIMDWRDLDDLRRGQGAEREDYLQAEAPVLPPNGPFGEVDDLRLVLGVSAAVYERIAPHLTVTGSGRVNLVAAPAEVLAALPGLSSQVVQLILRSRANTGSVSDLLTLTAGLDEPTRNAIRASLPTLLSRVTYATEEVVITSEARMPGSTITARVRAVAVRAGGAAFVVERVSR